MSDPRPDRPVREPLAIVGIGCHLPGPARNPDELWDLLRTGTDATREVPADRWEVGKFYDPDPGKSGKMTASRGGYLERIDQFDAQFFGISPREANWLDPQQRLLLRVAWEALEDGGQVAERLVGSDTGVFMGGFTLDYQLLQNTGTYGRYHLQAHSATGIMMTMLANRLSYIFGFQGPSLTVDTACSGSLVAVHLAAQSIWNGECSLALAGGVNVMISPTMTIAESKGGFLSPDGRCKTFDAAADGYARGEGAGVVVLKPLARALTDGDRVHALVRGTALSQDGRTNGITVPNPAAQEAVMRAACRQAGIAPHKIGYVEAHGTGTPVGDPIEARAIGNVVSPDRPRGERCVIGSVKTNIGHLEAAAGVAGLTKAALALAHRQIPPQVEFTRPNPDIPFDELGLHVPTRLIEWPGDRPRYAGVNSFGFGGTNAHVILQEAPRPESRRAVGADRDRPLLLPLSARSGEALVDLARSYREFLAGTGEPLYDVGHSAALRRGHHEHRWAIVARSTGDAVEQLDAFGSGDAPIAPVDVDPGRPPKIVFVCSGMGPQWWAMGRDLLADEPVFRAAVERCDAELRPYTGWSLMEELGADEDRSRMDETDLAQPANFAIQVGLAALWRSWGIEPDAVIGHSAGEVAAQYLAGVLDLADAVKVIYYRSSLQQRTSGSGAMLAVGMTPETVDRAVRDAGPSVSIAAINGPSAVTLSGDTAILERMAGELSDLGVFHRRLTVKVPYHSHLMDPLRADLLTVLADLRPRSATVRLYSTVTGTRIDGGGADAHYWWRNVRGTVLFAAAFGQVIADGHDVVVELGPHPVLSGPMRELLMQHGERPVVVGSLRRGEHDRTTLLASLGTLYRRGCDVAWDRLYDRPGRPVRLPSYPWQLRTYWTESAEAREDRHYSQVHPLLGQRIGGPHPCWEREIGTRHLPYLADHRIQRNVVLPGAAFVELALAAAREVYGASEIAVEDLAFRTALLLTDASDPRLRTTLRQEQGAVEISSYSPTAGGEQRWTLHATARLRLRGGSRAGLDVDGWRRRCPRRVQADEFYDLTRQMGFEYGPAFRTVESVETGPDRALGQVRIHGELAEDAADYVVHPSVLDAAFQVLLTAAMSRTASGTTAPTPYLPVGIDRIRVLRAPTSRMQVAAEIIEADDRVVVSDIRVLDPDGAVLVEIDGFRAQSLEAATSRAPERIDRGLYELGWPVEPRAEAAGADGSGPAAGVADAGSWLVFTDRGGVGDALVSRLAATGVRAVAVTHADVPELVARSDDYVLDQNRPEHVRALVERLSCSAPISRVVHLWSLDATCTEEAPPAALDRDQSLGALSVLHLMQALSQARWARPPRVWLVTRRAQAVGEEPGPVDVAQAPVWGLGRVVGHQEFPGMWGGLVDLDEGPVGEQAAQLAAEITDGGGEDQIAFRDGRRHVARLAASTRLAPPLPPAVRPDGSYLVTGGLGALGLLVARFLVRHGARRLVLMGRRRLPERARWHLVVPGHPLRATIDALLELERLGATVHLAAVDVADAEQLGTWLAEYRRQAWPPIRGVVHTAGVVRDELLVRMTTETYRAVTDPKVRGGWLLHRLLIDEPLEHFVLFSSTGSVVAAPGQGNYAAANAFLDALAHHRRALGLPAISIGWGPWSVGMVADLELEQVYARRGIALISPDTGTAILARVMGQRPAQLTAVDVDWATARETWPPASLPPMLSTLGRPVDEGDDPDGADPARSLRARLTATPAAERTAVVTEHLQETVARVLGLDAGAVGAQESLTGLGLDSMMAIEIKHRVEAALEVEVSVLELLQGTTVTGLAESLVSELDVEQPGAVDGAGPDPVLAEIERLIAEHTVADVEQLLRELEQEGGESQ